MSTKASPESGAHNAEVIASASLPHEELKELVQAFPPGAYFLGEHLPNFVVDDDRSWRRLLVRLARLKEVQQEQGPLPWTVYTWGRVFSAEGELRWDSSEGKLRVVYLGHERLLPARLRESSQPLIGLRRCSVSYDLFGERPREVRAREVGVSAQEERRLFLTTRIPRPLLYPIEEEEQQANGQQVDRVKLKISLYQDPATGETVYFRCTGLETEAASTRARPRGGSL
ncbi:type III-D CRISPR-associated protein Csx19 [Thermogemmatispora tikiterensis]|uniref:Uncharacterized protein n=1 Tax=Thermogemmatispora tikiterensis TaxID=1825093 RepID=A0A328VG93_9CHLR|nr:CRISPR-associated protein Csx19 [Thermogemmatispora tikiterensis]RAQ96009.1 hypothetical protein A4R35_10730 [Thermogemmatispora tikiterensis]